MALLSEFDIGNSELTTLSRAALAAFSGGPIPDGYSVITPGQLGVADRFRDGDYFTNNGASAIVLERGNEWIIAFRGTDGQDDIARYPELFFRTYIDSFRPLLNAVVSNAPADTDFAFTGASLGGGATNLMADIADSQYGGRFSSAQFVAFASPNITDANGILNVGFENDPVFKALAGYSDRSSSLDNLVLASDPYMEGNYDGRSPFSDYAHNASGALEAFERLQRSMFLDRMNPDSVLILDRHNGTVQDITPGRDGDGAFYIGENSGDTLVGRNGSDFLEGFDGDDRLEGGSGEDELAGGSGNDNLFGGDDEDRLYGGDGDDHLEGGSGGDRLEGGAGDDALIGGSGPDAFVFGTESGSDRVADFESEDVLELSASRFADFAAVVAGASQVEDDTLIVSGDQFITLQGVAVSSLVADNFSFG